MIQIKPKLNTYHLLLSLVLATITNVMVYQNRYHQFLIVSWLLSMVLLLASGLTIKIKKKNLSFHPTQIYKLKLAGIVITLLLPTIIRIVIINTNSNHFHDDEFLISYYAAKASLTSNIFSGFPQDNDWETKYPLTFYLLPKIFIQILGANIQTIKISTIPHILTISIFLYLIAKTLFNKKIAVISLIMYAFLPISVYLETLGANLVSSSTVFLPFLYVAVLNYKNPSNTLSLTQGILCALNYLFYNASFIAFPVMTAIFIIMYFKEKKLIIIRNYFLAIFAFLAVLGPFITYAYKFENYFTRRIDQVFILTGTWSTYADKIAQGEETVYSTLYKQATDSIKSLYTSGIGGSGGYNFAHLAFFEPTALLLVLIGIILGFIHQKRAAILLIITIIFLSFAMTLLSAPPPSFHRLTLTFPFLSILISIPFAIILALKNLNPLIKYSVVSTLLGIYILNSYNYTKIALAEDEYFEPTRLASFINRKYPQRDIYVASFPGYAFEKIYYFSENKNARSIKTDYHINFLENFTPSEKYLYVIIFPEEFTQKIKDDNPQSKIVYQSRQYSVIVN